MTLKQENLIRPFVENFVAEIGGTYREHISDKALVTLLMYKLRQKYYNNNTFINAIFDGDNNAAYEAVCPIFEVFLEYGAGVNSNGHHRAQQFAQQLMSRIKGD